MIIAKMSREDIISQATFIVNHSGGKDSQAMYLYLTKELGIDESRIHVVHANLHEADWHGVQEHIQDTVDHPVEVVSAIYDDGSMKTFTNRIAKKGLFPGPATRWCTSELKNGPIGKIVTKLDRESGKKLYVNCMGIRSAESDSRKKRGDWSLNKKYSTKSRMVYDWYPIFDWSIDKVFQTIYDNDQEPIWVYAAGMSRCSCRFCIFAGNKDIYNASLLDPEGFQQICDLEVSTGHSFGYDSNKDEQISIIEMAAKGWEVVNGLREEKTHELPCEAWF